MRAISMFLIGSARTVWLELRFGLRELQTLANPYKRVAFV